jgi:hypothetical protein
MDFNDRFKPCIFFLQSPELFIYCMILEFEQLYAGLIKQASPRNKKSVRRNVISQSLGGAV